MSIAAAHARPESQSIALIGDVHSAWTAADTEAFNASEYPLLLVTGDLGGSQARDGLSIARSMAALTRRTLVMPGNNDVRDYARIAAELTYRQARTELLEGAPGHGPRTCGYSSHELQLGALGVTVIAARPFAMGGGQVSFPEELQRNFGIATIEQSTVRLCELVDAAATDALVFFAHNGPLGLGAERDALWGRDFDPAAGDWGDRDLRDAIAYAVAHQRSVLAVVAGHMHWSLRGGGERRWQMHRDGVLYVNGARVPRVFEANAGWARQHIALSFDDSGAHAREVLVQAAFGRTSEAP